MCLLYVSYPVLPLGVLAETSKTYYELPISMSRVISLLLLGAGIIVPAVFASDILLFTSPNCRQSFASLMNSIASTGCIDAGDNLTAAQSLSAAGDPVLGLSCVFFFFCDSKCRTKTNTVTSSSADCACITITSKNSIRSLRVSCAAETRPLEGFEGTSAPHLAKLGRTSVGTGALLVPDINSVSHEPKLPPVPKEAFPSPCNGTINEHLILQQGDRYYDTATDTAVVVTDVSFGSQPYTALPPGTQVDTCASAAMGLVLAGGTGSGASTVVSYG